MTGPRSIGRPTFRVRWAWAWDMCSYCTSVGRNYSTKICTYLLVAPIHSSMPLSAGRVTGIDSGRCANINININTALPRIAREAKLSCLLAYEAS